MVVIIFDGSKSMIGIKEATTMIGYYEIPDDTEITMSASQERYTVTDIVGESTYLVKKGDVVKLESKYSLMWGGIVEVEITENNIAQITIGWCGDCLNNGVVKTGNTTGIDISMWLKEQYIGIFGESYPIRLSHDFWNYFNDNITFQDNTLTLAQCIRQARRQDFHLLQDELVDPSDGLWQRYWLEYIVEKKPTGTEYEYEIDLFSCINYTINFSKSDYNSIRAFQEVANALPIYRTTVYMGKNGSIYYYNSNPNLTLIETPIISIAEVYGSDLTATQVRQEAMAQLRSQQFTNNIEVVVDRNWIYYDKVFHLDFINEDRAFVFDYDEVNRNLGNVGYITLPSGLRIKTLVDEITLKGELIYITFGLGTTKLFDRIYSKDIKGGR